MRTSVGLSQRGSGRLYSGSGRLYSGSEKPKKAIFRGLGGGVPKILFSLESSYFFYLGTHAKFRVPSYLLSGRKERASEEEEEERRREIMPSTMATT